MFIIIINSIESYNDKRQTKIKYNTQNTHIHEIKIKKLIKQLKAIPERLN